MAKVIVYLSKSNLADPELVSLVRTKLRKLGCEILDYSDHEDDGKKIDSAHLLVVIPPREIVDMDSNDDRRFREELNPDDNNDEGYPSPAYWVGKGNFTQVTRFVCPRTTRRTESQNSFTAFVYNDHNGYRRALRILSPETYDMADEIVGIREIEGNWKDRYGILAGDHSSVSLHYYVEKIAVDLGIIREDESLKELDDDEIEAVEETKSENRISPVAPTLLLAAAYTYKVL